MGWFVILIRPTIYACDFGQNEVIVITMDGAFVKASPQTMCRPESIPMHLMKVPSYEFNTSIFPLHTWQKSKNHHHYCWFQWPNILQYHLLQIL